MFEKQSPTKEKASGTFEFSEIQHEILSKIFYFLIIFILFLVSKLFTELSEILTGRATKERLVSDTSSASPPVYLRGISESHQGGFVAGLSLI